MDFASLSDTDLQAALHTLATQLAQARAQNDVARVQQLLGQFQLAVQEYGNRDTAGGLTVFLNTVEQNTQDFLNSLLDVPAKVGGATGKGLWELLKPLLPIIIVILIGIVVLVYVAGKGGAVRIHAVP